MIVSRGIIKATGVKRQTVRRGKCALGTVMGTVWL
jgi:hypothetical protein